MKTIYLDTYDYSRIIKDKNPNIFFESIDNLKNNGYEFYFSSISITETKPDTTSKNKDIIYKHANAIEKICDSKPLIHFLELFELEKEALQSKTHFDCNQIFSADNWLHSKLKDDLLKEHQIKFDSILNNNANRELRRNKKKYQDVIRTNILKSFSTDSTMNSLIGADVYKRSINNCKDLNTENLINFFTKLINSPVNSVKLFSNNKINGVEFSYWLSNAANLYRDELIESLRSSGNDFSDLKKIESDLTISIVRSLTDDNTKSILDYKEFCKGIYCMSRLTSKVLIDSIKPEKYRSAKPSDFGDFLNICYVPYLDMVRVDNYIHGKMKSYEYQDKIFSGDLKDFLDSLIKNNI